MAIPDAVYFHVLSPKAHFRFSGSTARLDEPSNTVHPPFWRAYLGAYDTKATAPEVDRRSGLANGGSGGPALPRAIRFLLRALALLRETPASRGARLDGYLWRSRGTAEQQRHVSLLLRHSADLGTHPIFYPLSFNDLGKI